MANYRVTMQRTASASLEIGTIGADNTTPRRQKIKEIRVGYDGTPADNAFTLKCRRCTALGTSSAVTAVAVDGADAAALADCGENHTVTATYTSNSELIDDAYNQRAGCLYQFAPGDELVIPATAVNGIGFETPVTPLIAVRATVCFQEQ